MNEDDIVALRKARDVLNGPHFKRCTMYGICSGLVIVAICALEQILAVLEPIVEEVKKQHQQTN